MAKQFKSGDVVVLSVPYQPAGSDKSFTHGILIGVKTMVENMALVYNAILFNAEKNNMLLGNDGLPEATSITAENIKAAKSKNGRKKGTGKKKGDKKDKKDKKDDQQQSGSATKEPSVTP